MGLNTVDQVYTPQDVATIVEVLRIIQRDEAAQWEAQPDLIEEVAREMAAAAARSFDKQIMEAFLGR